MDNTNYCPAFLQCSKYGQNSEEISQKRSGDKPLKDDIDVDTVSMTVSITGGADGCEALDNETCSISTTMSAFSKWENNSEKMIQSPRFTFMILDEEKDKNDNEERVDDAMVVVDQTPTDNMNTSSLASKEEEEDDNFSLNPQESAQLDKKCEDERFELLEDESLKLMIKEMQKGNVKQTEDSTNVPKSIELSKNADKDGDSIWGEVGQLPSKEAKLKKELSRARLKTSSSSRMIHLAREDNKPRDHKGESLVTVQTDNKQLSWHEKFAGWLTETLCCAKS